MGSAAAGLRGAGTRQGASGPSTFLPVIAVDAPAPALLLRPASERRPSSPPSRSAAPVWLWAQPPNAVKLEARMHGKRYRTDRRDGCRVGSVAMFRFDADLKVF